MTVLPVISVRTEGVFGGRNAALRRPGDDSSASWRRKASTWASRAAFLSSGSNNAASVRENGSAWPLRYIVLKQKRSK